MINTLRDWRYDTEETPAEAGETARTLAIARRVARTLMGAEKMADAVLADAVVPEAESAPRLIVARSCYWYLRSITQSIEGDDEGPE